MRMWNTWIGLKALLLLACLGGTASADTYVVFSGDFERATGAPVTMTKRFVAAENLAHTVRIFNGGRDHQFRKVASSAVVTLNGEPLVKPQELSQRVWIVEKQATLLADNELVVQLRSAPGSGLTIEILGTVELDLAYTEDLQLVWWNPPIEIPGGVSVDPSPEWSSFGAFYRANVPEGYHSLGDYGQRDTVELMIDPDGDGQNYFELQVSPTGLVFDTRFDTVRRPAPIGYADWQSGLEAGVHVRGTVNDDDNDDGYTVEGRIPFSAFSVGRAPASPPGVGDSWRVALYLLDARREGQRGVGWSPPLVGDFHVPERFGRVTFGP